MGVPDSWLGSVDTGSTEDLENINSRRLQNSPFVQQGQNPDTATPPPAPAPAPAPSKGFGSRLKESLQRFAYYGGQAGMKSVGLPTDDEIQQHEAQMAHIKALTAQTQAQIQQAQQTVPVTLANGTTIMAPMALAKTLLPAQERTSGQTTVANIRANSAESIAADNNATKVAVAGKKTPNEIGLIIAAQQGDGEAQKTLDTLQGNRIQLVRERGNAFGQARLWSLQKVLDPETGQTGFMTGFGVLQAQKEGKQLIPAGSLSQKEIVSVQQLQSEAFPALKGVRENIHAFDNSSDRKIFARVMEGAGKPAYGQEAGWMGTILNQALKEGLSPEGQKEAQALARLSETMGRLRSTLGLPATDQSMAVTLALLPGKSTPNAKYAGQQVDQIEEMIKQAVGIPAYGGRPRSQSNGGQQQPAPTSSGGSWFSGIPGAVPKKQ